MFECVTSRKPMLSGNNNTRLLGFVLSKLALNDNNGSIELLNSREGLPLEMSENANIVRRFHSGS